MLMKSGGLKKGEIGAIKIVENKTFVEIAPKGVEGFLDTIGPDMKIEKAITVSRVEGKPDLNAPSKPYRSRDRDNASGKTRRNPYGDKPRGRKDGGKKDGWKDGGKSKNWEERSPSRGGDDRPKRNKSETSESSGFKRKPRKKTHADMPSPPAQDFSNGKPKKPHKKKLARAAALKDGKGTKKGAKKNTRKSRKKT